MFVQSAKFIKAHQYNIDNNFSINNEDEWDDMCEFLFNIIEFEKVMKKYLKNVMEQGVQVMVQQ